MVQAQAFFLLTHISDTDWQFKEVWKHLLKPQQSSAAGHSQVLGWFFSFLRNTILCPQTKSGGGTGISGYPCLCHKHIWVSLCSPSLGRGWRTEAVSCSLGTHSTEYREVLLYS